MLFRSAMLKNIGNQLEKLNGGISDLQVKILNAETRISSLSEAQTSLINKMATKPVTIDENPFATANAIQVRIDDNVRILAELHARWEREDEIARNNKMTKVCTITPTSNTEISSASVPPTTNGKVGDEGKPTFSKKKPRTIKPVSDKCAEIFQSIGNSHFTFDNNDFDFDSCNISEVIKFLQRLPKSPNASAIDRKSVV